jgi:hypothetical protein
MYPIRRQLVGDREAKRVVDPHPVEISGQKGHSRATTDAVINAVVDSGPTESWREEPTTAYTSSGPTIAQSPTTGGSPATSA